MSPQSFPRRPGVFPRSFHVVAKPVGARCNLDCTYCYYLHKEDLLPGRAAGRMSDDLLEEFIRQYIAGQEVEEVNFLTVTDFGEDDRMDGGPTGARGLCATPSGLTDGEAD